jgi:hypothetical protein
MPFYNGKIEVKGSNGEELSVPYAGMLFYLVLGAPPS